MSSDQLKNQFSSESDLVQTPFRFYQRMHARTFTLGLIALLFTNICDHLSPLALKVAMDAITSKNGASLNEAILIYLGLMIGWTLFRYMWRIWWGRFHHAVAEDLRNRIFNKLTTLGPNFYHKNPVGQLMSLITNDVNSFRSAIGPGLLIAFDAGSALLVVLPSMIWLSWSWTWKTLILLPLIPPFMRKMETLIHLRFREEQDLLSDVSGTSQEIVSGVRVIKAYTQEANKLANFEEKSLAYELASNKVAFLDAVFQPVMEFSVASGTVILLYVCSGPVMQGAVTIGTLFAFQDYIRRLIWPMSAIGFSVSMIEQGRASFARIRDLLVTATDIPDEGSMPLPTFERLDVRDLSFSYGEATNEALRNVSFTIEAGETVGIVGPVGSGKTTLLQILCRLFPVATGHVLYNGISLEQIQQKDLRRVVSLVPQDAFLFSDTVGENIALGLDMAADMTAGARAAAEIRHFTQIVNMEEEVESLPSRFDAQLGERGVNLSGGQKQRLTIARALIRQSPFVILDDSLSAVDGKTEKSIVEQLRGALQKQTVLIVSHRLATLKHADKIIVLREGSIEAIGRHAELMQTSPTYQKFEALQSSRGHAAKAADV